MKIKHDFVTNSSSTNYILIYTPMNNCEYKEGDIAIGEHVAEVYNYIHVTKEIAKWLNSHKTGHYINTLEHVKPILEFEADTDVELTRSDLHFLLDTFDNYECIRIRSIEVDNHSCDSIEDLEYILNTD